jgi:hypothetical protein
MTKSKQYQSPIESKIIISKQNDLKSEFSSITNIPGFVIAKDIHSRYSVISKDYAFLLGWKSPDQCIDLADFDIPCEAAKAPEQFRALDQKVLDTPKVLLSVCICNYSSSWKTFISNKTPIQQENGTVARIYGQVMDVSNTNIFSVPLGDIKSLAFQAKGR